MFIPSGFPTRLTTIPILVYYHFSRELLTHKVFPMRTRTSILRFSHFSTIFLFAHFFYTDCSLPPFCDFLGLHETGTIIHASCGVLGVLRSLFFSFFSRHFSFGFFFVGSLVLWVFFIRPRFSKLSNFSKLTFTQYIWPLSFLNLDSNATFHDPKRKCHTKRPRGQPPVRVEH